MSDRKTIRGSSITFGPAFQAWIDRQLARQKALGTNLSSTAYANIVDLVSEGEIVGLVNGLKSIFFDETPLQNADGSLNFGGVQVDSRNGTQVQTYIPGFGEVQDDVNVGVKILKASPVTRTIVNVNIDAVVIKLTTPSLTFTDKKTGEIKGNSVAYKIQVQSNGGGFVDVVSSELIGKSSSQYQQSHRVELTGAAPWDIRLVRLDADSIDPYNTNDLYFDSYTEIIDVKLRYPNSAIVATKVDSSKFSSIPQRAFEMRGLKIRIPSNATPRADGSLTYSGSWDGTFTTAYSNNPAWCFYDLVTSNRYGCGDLVPASQVDKWALYSIGAYCDQLIDNFSGGTEPRFSCNIYLQSAEQAFKVLSDMATIFRGMAYWANGSITAIQDAPQDPAYLYTQANVIDGNFIYSGASRRAIHSVALVTWNDPLDFYRPKVEYVEDQVAIAKYGVVKTQVTAIGCTSQSQAHRVGQWILYSEQNESEVVTFKTGIEGSVARPGQVINIADANRAGKRMAGRISSATLNTILVDGDLDTSYVGATIIALLPNNTVESKIIQSQVGRLFTTATNFSIIPSTIWMINSSDVQVQTFRVLSVAETKTSGEIEISGLKYNSNKYTAVETGITLAPRNYSTFGTFPATPQNLLITENLYTSPFGVKAKATLSWDKLPNVANYLVKYQKDNDNPVNLGMTTANEIEILDLTPGNYSFEVNAVNPLGIVGPAATLTQNLYGKSAPPLDVQNFSLFPNGNAAFLSWTQTVDLDVLVGGSVRIRHTPRFTNQTWGSSIDVIDFVPGSDTFATAPLLPGTYLAKFVDSSGNESVTEAIVLTTVPLPVGLNVVLNVVETGVFAGTFVNTEFNPSIGLTLTTSVLWDDLPLIDSITSLIDWPSNVVPSGSYYFAQTQDLGQVFTSNLTAKIQTLSFDIGLLIDDITDLVDTWSDFDGANVAEVNAKLFLRTTNDDPTLTPTWSVWKPFLQGSYQARAYQFRLDLTSNVAHQNIAVQVLEVVIDMPDRTEDHPGLISGTVNPYHVAFDYSFRDVPAVGIVTHNMNSGDFYVLSNKTISGFDIVFKDSTNTIVSRTFDAVIKGYGLKV